MFIFSINVIASPDQIDVIGLKPGVTTVQEFHSAGKIYGNSSGIFEIGGYRLICAGEFKNNLLDAFFCKTGGKLNKDTNTQIHETLKTGFNTKFGSPDKDTNESVRTRIGVEYQSNEVLWVDSKGNALILKSMSGKIDEGEIVMYSDKRMQLIKNEAEQKELSRKF